MYKVYMEVSNDIYRLPLVVADTKIELARLCDDSMNNIHSIISKGRRGVIKKPRYIVVEVNEEEAV